MKTSLIWAWETPTWCAAACYGQAGGDPADPKAHRYSASKGIPGLRKALSGYYKRRFDVEINPDTETIVTLGSKEGLANLAQAITAPGDVILVPNPTYPIHHFGFIIAGATIRHLPPGTQG